MVHIIHLIVRFWELLHWVTLKELQQNRHYHCVGKGVELYVGSLG